MDSILQKYQRIRSRLQTITDEFDRLKSEEKQLIQDNAALRQKAKEDAEKGIETILRQKSQVQAFIDTVKYSIFSVRPSEKPLPYNDTKLKILSVQIEDKKSNDPYAVKLFVEATGQMLYLNQHEKIMKEQYDKAIQLQDEKNSKAVSLCREKISKLEKEYERVLRTEEFQDILTYIQRDKNIFSSHTGSLAKKPYTTISLGTIADALPIPSGLEAEVSLLTKGICDRTGYIRIPANYLIGDIKCIVAEFDNQTEALTLRGVQSFLVNIACYYREEFKRIVYIDPIRYNGSMLGSLSQLAIGNDSYIETIPTNANELRLLVQNEIQQISALEKQGYGSLNYGKVFIFHDFPQSYDSTTLANIQRLCVNAEHYGIKVVLTNRSSERLYTQKGILDYICSFSLVISLHNGVFSIKSNGRTIGDIFEWYKPPYSLPVDIRKALIEEKPVISLSNDYSDRLGLSQLPMYKKGNRLLENIAYGVDQTGAIQSLDFEEDNFASFICGAARSGKSTLLHTLITEFIKKYHPDDIEIWLIDFKKVEFSRYIKHTPPHVRYIILDESPEMVFDIIDRLTEVLKKRELLFKGKWLKLKDVPQDKYMPAILVIIDEFPIMSQVLAGSYNFTSENYIAKLDTLLEKGGALGFHFIFSSQGYSDGIRGLSSFARLQIQQRIAMKIPDVNEIKATLGLTTVSDKDKSMMDQLAKYNALMKIPETPSGDHLKQSKVIYIPDYKMQESLIDKIRNSITVVKKFEPQNEQTYIDKMTLTRDGKAYCAFETRYQLIHSYLISHSEDLDELNEIALFIGDPKRMSSLSPIILSDSFGENMLLIGPKKEKDAISSIILSIEQSARLQDKPVELWGMPKNLVLKNTKNSIGVSAKVTIGVEKIVDRIKAVKDSIKKGVYSDRIIAIIGIESLLQEEITEDTLIDDDEKVFFERRENGEMDLLQKMKEGYAIEDTDASVQLTIDSSHQQKQSVCNVRAELSYLLKQGPKNGFHFVVLFDTVSEFDQSKFSEKLFRHKVFFKIPKQEAIMFMNGFNAETVAKLDEHSFRYSNGTECNSFHPYLHEKINIDGWTVVGNQVINVQAEDTDYLL